MVDFMQKKSMFLKLPLLILGPPPAPNEWLTSPNLYQKMSNYMDYLMLFKFSKIFYSKKNVFFVPRIASQIVKMLNFDPHLAPPTFGGGA